MTEEFQNNLWMEVFSHPDKIVIKRLEVDGEIWKVIARINEFGRPSLEVRLRKNSAVGVVQQ